MNIRLPRLAMGVLVAAAFVLTPASSWAVYYGLGPSEDEWGLQYELDLSAAGGDMVNVAFTLADEGRLKPVYSFTVVAFSKPDRSGGRSYEVKARIELKPTENGKRAGQVQIRKEFVDRAMIRVLTLTVDGKRQTAGAAYYDIPLQKHLNKASDASPLATPPAAKVSR